MSINKRVRQIRKSKGITGTFVAKKLGIAVQTYNGYELGRRSIKASTLEEIAKILNEPIEKFFEDDLHETEKIEQII
ncbi:helix-turn-helix domain-containing protein [Virgibacillus salexigens]|uniref:Helix-turn-helix n=1 Tax=Virgibacillus massiliensis TaxID=1462526 RepID=A0A024QHS8_9BACI|nr:helix-turn-helix transcriptional regulator [Virgibacillus massiliensis]CDQ41471.1 Helix-turn-helix [Virgibacillus massiliensis]